MASISVPSPVPTATEDAENIRKAAQGWGTDEKALIEILGHRTAAQRAEIAVAYEGLYNESLLDRLHSELSGDFRSAMMLWTADPAARDAKLAHEALKNKGDRHAWVLIEVACASTPDHLVTVRKAYREAYAASLEEDVAACSLYKDPLRQARPPPSLLYYHACADLDMFRQSLSGRSLGRGVVCGAVPGAARHLVPVLRRARRRRAGESGGRGAARCGGDQEAAAARRRRAHRRLQEQGAAEDDVRAVQAGARQGHRRGPRGTPQRPARGRAQDGGVVLDIAGKAFRRGHPELHRRARHGRGVPDEGDRLARRDRHGEGERGVHGEVRQDGDQRRQRRHVRILQWHIAHLSGARVNGHGWFCRFERLSATCRRL